ncbi:ribosome silencing factor [Kiritimatiellaeota bacterium B1221]|nr:ribosome silencing factor [Kiritimatiellaeota bacterium B1221]
MNETYPLSLRIAVDALRARLAEDLKILYVRDVSTVTDYFVLATGSSTPHLHALSQEVDIARKDARIKMTRKGGGAQSGWMVLDFGDIIVHVMTPELREFYALEQLWSDAKTVDADSIQLNED